MKQLDLFWNTDEDQVCVICGEPLSLTQILESKNLCEECEYCDDSVNDGDFTNNGDIL